MTDPYAEVIGNPVTHSLSPVIHCHWLQSLSLPGDFRATRCTADDFPAYLASRRADPAWRGCSVTMPLKEQAAALVDILSKDASASGAVNCILRSWQGSLHGRNTDIRGVARALAGTHLAGRSAIVIGAGGAARAVIAELSLSKAVITVVARSRQRASPLRDLAPGLEITSFDGAPTAIADAALVANASPLGMTGAPPMPETILASLPSAPSALALDMVYRPLATPFLRAAAGAGLRTAGGLTVLIGQARLAFISFFGATPPDDDADLRALLIRQLAED